MSRSRALLVLAVLVAAVLAAQFWRRRPPAPVRPPVVPSAAVAQPVPPPAPPPEPAPHPPSPLPPFETLSLPMADGNPLRARWHPSPQPSAPVLVLDLGAGSDPRPWLGLVQALLAQRPAQLLWLDDLQRRHPDDAPRQLRAVARWQAALAWLAVRAPDVRLVLIGAHEAGDAVWHVADVARPLSLAVIAPEQAPPEPLKSGIAERFTLVALPLADASTPTWLRELPNARLLRLPAAHALEDEQVRADLAGWLFVALGPR